MHKLKPFLITAAIVFVAVAVISRVAPLRKLAFNQSA